MKFKNNSNGVVYYVFCTISAYIANPRFDFWKGSEIDEFFKFMAMKG